MMLHPPPAVVSSAFLAIRQPRVLAHTAGDSGFWDEFAIFALLLVIVGAIWLFIRSSGDTESAEPPPEE